MFIHQAEAGFLANEQTKSSGTKLALKCFALGMVSWRCSKLVKSHLLPNISHLQKSFKGSSHSHPHSSITGVCIVSSYFFASFSSLEYAFGTQDPSQSHNMNAFLGDCRSLSSWEDTLEVSLKAGRWGSLATTDDIGEVRGVSIPYLRRATMEVVASWNSVFHESIRLP